MSTSPRVNATIFREVSRALWPDAPTRGVFMCAASRRRSKNFPASVNYGELYEFERESGEVSFKRAGQEVFRIPEKDFDGIVARTFLFPIARLMVPISLIESVSDFNNLAVGDLLVALRATVENPEYAGADPPLVHEGQLAYVQERSDGANGQVGLTISGIARSADVTDFGETYYWTSGMESVALNGSAPTNQHRFPLGTFLAKVHWPEIEGVNRLAGDNVLLGDLIVAGPSGIETNESAFEPGEPALVEATTNAHGWIAVHSNSGREELSPSFLASAGCRVAHTASLRVPLSTERARRLQLGTHLWLTGSSRPLPPSIPEGSLFVVLSPAPDAKPADGFRIAPVSRELPPEAYNVPWPEAGAFAVEPEAEAIVSRVPLTRERALRMVPGESMWARANRLGDLAPGEEVRFESVNEKRNRIAWKTLRGKPGSGKLKEAIDGGWFEVSPTPATSAPPPAVQDPRAPLTRSAFDGLQAGSILVGAVNDASAGITEGSRYTVRSVVAGSDGPLITITTDHGADRAFTRNEAPAFFDLLAQANAEPEAEDEAEDAPAPGAAQTAQNPPTAGPADPKETLEEQEYRRELIRDRPPKGPNFRHRQRVLNALRRLLGEPGAGGLYTPGLYTLAEYGPLYDALRAAWLVRGGSNMLMGIAGVGKTTFIKYGTRLMCGAPPRLTATSEYEAALSEPDARARREALAALKVGTLRVGGRPVPATHAAFDELIAHEAQVRKEPWMIPADPDAALRIERRRRLGRKAPTPEDEPALFMPGTSEHIKLAWDIHDAANNPAMLSPSASPKQREQAEAVAAALSEADAAFYREIFNSFFDYFSSTFIGEAKADPEKSPDEVLYRTKVLSVTYPDVGSIAKAIPDSFGIPQGAATETVIFPEAQAIVLAPVKFVNETNRMSRALGDAFLGLLAEGEIEFRGQKFRSPDSLWWFDMNPHLGWGTLDWAFLDRIDISVIIPSIGYGAKVAFEDAKQGRRRAQEAAFVFEAPEFSLDELGEIWRDVEAVDLGGYWDDALMKDLGELDLLLPTEKDKKEGKPAPTYDPIYAIRFGAAMLEYFIATPEGFDFSRFVSHPNKSPDPHDPRSGGGDHWEDLFNKMLEENKIQRDDVATITLYAKLQRPFGFRAQASLRKYSKGFAWLRGSPRVELDDVLGALPFVLNHRLTLNYEESNMGAFFSVYDWLTRKLDSGQANGAMQGQVENVKDRLTVWTPALAQLYKLQILHTLMVAPESANLIKPAEYEKVIDLAKKWVGPNDSATDDRSIVALAQQHGAADGVLRQVETEAKNMLLQIEQEKDNAVVRTIPDRVKARRFTRRDVAEWETKLAAFATRAANKRTERELRAAIAEAKRYLTIEIPFIGDGLAGFTSTKELDLDNEGTYRGVVGIFFSLVPDATERSQVLPEWSAAESRYKTAKAAGTDMTTLPPFELALPKVGKLTISYESNQPPHKVVRVAFDTAQAGKKARTYLQKDFKYDPDAE